MKKLLLALLFLAFTQEGLANLNIVDLTHSFNKKTLNWPTAKPFHLQIIFAGRHHNNYFYASNDFSMSEHVGTHMDAPYHFASQGLGASGVPLSRLIGPGVLVNVSKKTANNPNYQITIEDFKRWQQQHGSIPQHAIVLIDTGFYKRWPNRKGYTGTAYVGQRALPRLHFPGLSPAAARWLIKQKQIKAVGIDTLSIDYGQSKRFLTHQILAKNNVPFFENVAHLNKLPAKGFTVVALPMKIDGGTGAPVRIIALLGKKLSG